MIESSRKHGPFDPRYPRQHPRPTFVPTGPRQASKEEEGRLDWQAFSTRFCPDHRRHDLQLLEAYEAYSNGSQAYEAYRTESQAYDTHLVEAQRSRAALLSDSLEAREDEGGAPLEPGTSSGRSRALEQTPNQAVSA